MVKNQKHFFLYFIIRFTSSSSDYQTSPMLFELGRIAGRKESVDFLLPNCPHSAGLYLSRITVLSLLADCPAVASPMDDGRGNELPLPFFLFSVRIREDSILMAECPQCNREEFILAIFNVLNKFINFASF